MGAGLLVQVLGEGFRWQLIPLYIGCIGLAVDDIAWEDRTLRLYLRFRRAGWGLVGLALMLVLPWGMPIPRIPTPTGPYGVATQTFILETGAEEIYSQEPGQDRRIPVQIWYPAEIPDDSVPLHWVEPYSAVGPALARNLGLPGFFLDHTRGVRSHSHPIGKPYLGSIPVVIYSHGWTGYRGVALPQLESLASHGYLVIAADHTFASVAAVFSDTEVVDIDREALPDQEQVSESEFQQASENLVATMTADIGAIVDALAEGTAGPFGELAALADLSALGVYGHSAGGGAAVRWCLEDERCRAVLGLDPWVEPVPNAVIAMELQIPSMFFRSDPWLDTPNDGRLRGLAERSPSVSWWMSIRDTEHTDFVITPLLSPYASWFGLGGSIETDLLIAILDEHLIGFFDRYLLGVGGQVLEQASYPALSAEFIP